LAAANAEEQTGMRKTVREFVVDWVVAGNHPAFGEVQVATRNHRCRSITELMDLALLWPGKNAAPAGAKATSTTTSPTQPPHEPSLSP